MAVGRDIASMPKIRWNEKRRKYEASVGVYVDGEYKRVTMRNDSEDSLIDEIREIRRKEAKGLDVLAQDHTIESWLSTWLHHRKKNAIRENTWDNYEIKSRVNIIPAIGKVKLKDLTTDLCQKFINSCYEPGARKDKRKDREHEGLSPATVKDIFKTLNCALNQALKEGLITINPLDEVSIQRPPKTTIEVLSPAQVEQLQNAAATHRLRAIIPVALGSGSRRSELLGLKWSNVGLKEGEGYITIAESRVRTATGKHLKSEVKSLSGYRTVPISDLIVRELKEHRKRQIEEREKIEADGQKYDENNLVFCYLDGRPIKHRRFDLIFKRWVKKAKIGDITFHQLRHNYVSHLLAQNVPIRLVQELVGHSDVSTTLRIYGHLIKGAKNDVATKLDFLFQGEKPKEENQENHLQVVK